MPHYYKVTKACQFIIYEIIWCLYSVSSLCMQLVCSEMIIDRSFHRHGEHMDHRRWNRPWIAVNILNVMIVWWWWGVIDCKVVPRAELTEIHINIKRTTPYRP